MSSDKTIEKTTLVVPCYNEEHRLSIEKFESFLCSHQQIHMIFVDDGSTDDTLKKLQLITRTYPSHAKILSLPENRGKAHTVRTGMQEALKDERTKWVGFWDADLATPLFELNIFQKFIEFNPQAKALIGCRLPRLGSNIHRTAIRHYFGRIFATFAALIVGEPMYDSQCGAKLFRRDWARQIFQDPFLSRWCFDIELLCRIRNRFGKKCLKKQVIEIPLRKWMEKGESKIGLKDTVSIMWDLLRIARHYRTTNSCETRE